MVVLLFSRLVQDGFILAVAVANVHSSMAVKGRYARMELDRAKTSILVMMAGFYPLEARM